MSKKLSISQPTVIDTELTPLDDSFWIEANGVLQQWYYVSTGAISPDRTTTPLMLTPNISAIDHTTDTQYTPIFYAVRWYVNETQVTSTYNPQSLVHADYEIKDGTVLVVRKNNLSASQGIQIRCQAIYIDPRDTGRQYTVGDSLVLTTNLDASNNFPNIAISAPRSTSYNPLYDNSSQFSFQATIDWIDVTPTQDYQFLWYSVDDENNEVLINTLPYYVSGQNTNTIVLDAMYGKNIPIILRLKLHSTDATYIPKKVSCNLTWETPPLKGVVKSNMGSMVNTMVRTFEFDTIVNTNSGVVSEKKAKEHLRFHWRKYVVGSGLQPTSLGVAYRISIPASELVTANAQQNGSVVIDNEIYMLDEYKQVEDDNGNTITYGGENVFART
jgi:hypothetical protein